MTSKVDRPYGHSGGSSAEPQPMQAQGAEYGLPAHQIHARGGEVTVKVPADVADRFNRAVHKHSEESGGVGDNIDSDTHRSGMEPLTERARNLTEVTKEKMQSGGTSETRSPDVGFPASAEAEKEGKPHGQPEGQL